MIHTIISLCPITENSSNVHLLVNRFEYTTITMFETGSSDNEEHAR